MKLCEAIARVDEMRPNTVSEEEKISWLDKFDRTARAEIFDTHEDAPAENFGGYHADTSPDTELLIPTPYDEVYLYLLESRISYSLGEIGRFNNAAAMMQNIYENFARYYHRTHMPKKGVYKFF